MSTLKTSSYSFKDTLAKDFHNAKINAQKVIYYFGEKIESIKTNSNLALINVSSKIKKIIKENLTNSFFAIISICALWHGPYRFICASLLGLAIQKVNNEEKKRIVTSSNLALNILGIIGVILEKTICPICDPTYYLAPCICGIATSEALYNLYEKSFKTDQVSVV